MNDVTNDYNEPFYNVVIIGAGQIGAFYDRPGDENILSHAHAFSQHPHFRLLGFVDQDKKKTDQAVAVWGGQAFASMEEALAQEQVDVLCLAVPDEWHYEYLRKLAASQVRIVLAEKPLTQTWSQAIDIKNLFSANSAPAIEVNYTRRFVPEFMELSQQIQQNKLGKFLCGTGYYGKGLVHNGSHLIDLLRFLLGEINQVKFLAQEHDYYGDDPSISGQIGFANGGQVVLQVVDCRPYSVFELELFFEKKRLRILDAGFIIEELDVQEDPVFPGYRRLESVSIRTTSLGQAMYFAAENIYEYLVANRPLRCTLEDGFRVLEVCQRLREGEAE